MDQGELDNSSTCAEVDFEYNSYDLYDIIIDLACPKTYYGGVTFEI